MSTPVVSIPLEQRANFTTAEVMALDDQLARVTAQRDALGKVAAGASGYLRALPLAYQPDPSWFVPLDAALAALRAEGGAK